MAFKQRWEGFFPILDADGSGFITSEDSAPAAKVFIKIIINMAIIVIKILMLYKVFFYYVWA